MFERTVNECCSLPPMPQLRCQLCLVLYTCIASSKCLKTGSHYVNAHRNLAKGSGLCGHCEHDWFDFFDLPTALQSYLSEIPAPGEPVPEYVLTLFVRMQTPSLETVRSWSCTSSDQWVIFNPAHVLGSYISPTELVLLKEHPVSKVGRSVFS
jgi:hypothetical protein